MVLKSPRLDDFYSFGASCELNKRGQHVNFWFSAFSFDEHKKGTQVLPAPHLYLMLGRRLTDVVGSLMLVVSFRTMHVMATENFTGWSPFPVILRKKGGDPFPDAYLGIGVTGRSGKWSPPLTSERINQSELTRAMKKWDGSDFFLFESYLGVMVTRRVIDAMIKAEITGWKAHPINLSFSEARKSRKLIMH